jgi:hypothetical protein
MCSSNEYLQFARCDSCLISIHRFVHRAHLKRTSKHYNQQRDPLLRPGGTVVCVPEPAAPTVLRLRTPAALTPSIVVCRLPSPPFFAGCSGAVSRLLMGLVHIAAALRPAVRCNLTPERPRRLFPKLSDLPYANQAHSMSPSEVHRQNASHNFCNPGTINVFYRGSWAARTVPRLDKNSS